MDDLQMQFQLLTQKAKEADYSFHQMVKLKLIRTENLFMKVEFFIYQQKVKNNQVEQWEFYKAHITNFLNDAFANY
jgi:hypothetical protein